MKCTVFFLFISYHTVSVSTLPLYSEQTYLTFDDVMLVPQYSAVLPKETIVVTQLTKNITINIPLISAAMDTVTDARLAIALAREGGIGIIHKNMSIEEQVLHVKKVKKFKNFVVHDPVTMHPKDTIAELRSIMETYNISGVPVVSQGKLMGIVTNRDIRFEVDFQKTIEEVMTPFESLITAKEQESTDEILSLLRNNRIEKIPIINDQNQLLGMITAKDMQQAKSKPATCEDANGRLRVGAAVGVDATSKERIDALVNAGVDIIVIDSAHGHSQGIIDMVMWIKKQYPTMQVMAGNVATPEGAWALVEAGADAIKVGIGPGSICTTRIVTGIGIPQISALATIAHELRETAIPIIADGGIRFSGDICKALAAGASAVMIGNLFAGTEEAPGDMELYQGRAYKSYRGMGSIGAMTQSHASTDRYFQDNIQESIKLVPEGVEGRVPFRGNVQDVVRQLIGGLRSCMGYLGCRTIGEIHIKARFIQVTNAGLHESHVHDINITREAPNYSIKD